MPWIHDSSYHSQCQSLPIDRCCTPLFKHAIIILLLKSPAWTLIISQLLPCLLSHFSVLSTCAGPVPKTFQSAYHENQSTEIALPWVVNDFLSAFHVDLSSLLWVQALLAAFDIPTHDIHLHHLHVTFSLSGSFEQVLVCLIALFLW